jgi:hypothetical protein
MERGSVQHGPRLDDELEAEVADLTTGSPTESRARDDRGLEPMEWQAVPHDWTFDRSELARHLRPAAFPAERDELLGIAREEGSPQSIVDALEQLPAGRPFGSVGEVWRALGHDVERRAAPEVRPPRGVRALAARTIRLLGSAMEVAGRATSRAASVLEPGPSR